MDDQKTDVGTQLHSGGNNGFDSSLLRRRRDVAKGRFLGQLKRTKKLINDNARLEHIKNASFCNLDAHEELEVSLGADDAVSVVSELEDHISEFEAVSIEVAVRDADAATANAANQAVTPLGGPNLNASGQVSSIRSIFAFTPESLPTFDGNPLEFVAFWDRFKSEVHVNPELSEARKFGILASCLRGPPLEMIRGISQTDANYAVVVDLLFGQYHDVRVVVEAHVTAMLDLEVKSGKDLRLFYDKCEAHFRALKALGRDIDIEVQAGGLPACEIVLPILKRKLPEPILRKWELQLIRNSSGLSVGRFLNFLKEEVRLEERMRLTAQFSKVQTTQKSPKGKGKNRRKREVESDDEVPAAFAGSTLSYCPFCEEECHEKIEQCKSVKSLSIPVKLSTLQRYQMCYLCMVSRHAKDECTATGCGVADCKFKHHKLLHRFAKQEKEQTRHVKSNTASLSVRGTGMLQTVRAEVTSNRGAISVTMLLDPGSDTTFISEKMASRAGLKGKQQRIYLDTVGSQQQTVQSKAVSFKIRPVGDPETVRSVSALTLKKVASVSVPKEVCLDQFPHLMRLKLAPQSQEGSKSVDILIGADYYYDFVKPAEMVTGKPGEPVGVGTIFGWIITGPNPTKVKDHVLQVRTCQADFCSEKSEKEQLERFWQYEDGGISDALTPNVELSSDKVYQVFKGSTKFNGERYEIRLPWKASDTLPDNFDVAYECLKRSERKHRRNPKVMQAYDKAIKEYAELDFAEVVSDNVSDTTEADTPAKRTWFLPHHAVVREDRESTQIRIVFNGAVKYEGVSLNGSLHTGPSLLPSLISVHPDDRDALRYLWRDEDGSLQVLRFKRVIFGANCSPFLAIGTVHHHCDLKSDEYPLVSSIVKRDMYMDDFVSGANSVKEANRLAIESKELLQEGGFTLAKWTASHAQALEGISDDHKSGVMRKTPDERIQKILGVRWQLDKDVLVVVQNAKSGPTDQPKSQKLTKRSLLQDVASIFDPIGIVSPYSTTGRILLQDCWKQGVGWDADLPSEIESKYATWKSELSRIAEPTIRRFLFSDAHTGLKKIELHGFGDASERAYGAVVYMRYRNGKGQSVVQLLLSKGRVTPIKSLKLPKLEPMAALLNAQLLAFVVKEIDLPISKENLFAWSDSEIALHWIVGGKSTDTFVRNRVNKIRSLVNLEAWRHVAGAENPADAASRGVTMAKLLGNEEWLNGPEWLRKLDIGKTASFSAGFGSGRFEVSVNTASVSECSVEAIFDLTRFPFYKALAVTAWIKRFVSNARAKGEERNTANLSVKELGEAEMFWIRFYQSSEYQEEVSALKAKKSVPRQTSLVKLDPFLDEKGTLRVGGRIEQSPDSYAAKHPVILPRGTPVATRIVERTHENNLHAQTNHLLTILRQTYWIPRGRSFIKSVIGKCPKCRRYHSKPLGQMMGNLPEGRLSPAAPFEKCGVDFAGPLSYVINRETKEIGKAYICLFVCMAVRAVHLELLSDLSVDKFLQCFRRMTARRGATKFLLSDNAKTFKAAQRILEKAVSPLTKDGVTWQFIPERGPWAGGMYESLVKSVKVPLRKILGASLLSFEELLTVLCEVEAFVNSRPLTNVTDSLQDFEVLSPAHFLAGKQVSTKQTSSMPLKSVSRRRVSRNGGSIYSKSRSIFSMPSATYRKMTWFWSKKKVVPGARGRLQEFKTSQLVEMGSFDRRWSKSQMERSCGDQFNDSTYSRLQTVENLKIDNYNCRPGVFGTLSDNTFQLPSMCRVLLSMFL